MTREHTPPPRGSFKVEKVEPVPGFKNASLTTFRFDPNDTSIQDRVDAMLLRSASTEKNRKIIEELIGQERGERPYKPITEIGETDEDWG